MLKLGNNLRCLESLFGGSDDNEATLLAKGCTDLKVAGKSIQRAILHANESVANERARTLKARTAMELMAQRIRDLDKVVKIYKAGQPHGWLELQLASVEEGIHEREGTNHQRDAQWNEDSRALDASCEFVEDA